MARKKSKYISESFARTFTGASKKKRPDVIKTVQNSQRIKFAECKVGRNFTISGTNHTKWLTNTGVAAAYSEVIKTTHLETSPPTYEISLPNHDPLVIDAMVETFYFGHYTLQHPYQYKFVEQKELLNQHANSNNGTPLILLQLGVYSLGKDLGYAPLCMVSLSYLQRHLLSEPIDITTFLELKTRVWDENIDLANRDPSNMDQEGEELEVRKLLATYAAQWNSYWEKRYPALWELHTADTGDTDGFAFWFKKSLETVGKITKRVPLLVQYYSKMAEMEDRDMEDPED